MIEPLMIARIVVVAAAMLIVAIAMTASRKTIRSAAPDPDLITGDGAWNAPGEPRKRSALILDNEPMGM